MLESYKELIAAKSEIRQLKKQLEEAKSVVHAYWKYYKSARFFQCSRCGGPVVSDGYSYCPHCGAQMDEEKNN